MVQIPKTAENLIYMNFHSNRPNYKMVTDINEFFIPAERYIFHQA